MELSNEFVVPVPPEEAWPVLTDIERIAPCMPGATLDGVDGDEFSGRVKVKVGPIQLTYTGIARFSERDDDQHRAVIEAKGTDKRGGGTAAATITATLTARDATSTGVTVHTDLAVTGKPAQFGRSVMADVGDKLLGKFADCLANELASGEPESSADAAADEGQRPETGVGATAHEPSTSGGTRPRSLPEGSGDAIDLLDVAGSSVAKKLAPIVAAVVVLLVLVRLLRR